MAELICMVLTCFYAGFSGLNVSFNSLKGVLKALKESVISCFETNNYSFLRGCRVSDVELS